MHRDAKLTYERIIAEKTEVELKLGRMEEGNKVLVHEIDMLRSKLESVTHARDAIQENITVLEANLAKLDQDLRASQLREGELASAMLLKSRHHEEDRRSLEAKVNELQEQLSESQLQTQVAAETKAELEDLISQLLSVNQSLVRQLTHQSDTSKHRKASSSNKPKHDLHTKRACSHVSAPSRTSTKEFKTTRACRKTRAHSTEQGTQEALSKRDRNQQLAALHEMCVSLANSTAAKSRALLSQVEARNIDTAQSSKKSARVVVCVPTTVSHSTFSPTTDTWAGLSPRV
jgi:hypothetical protein